MLATGICSLLLGGAAWSQDASPASPASPAPQASPEKARALLDQVKKSDQDREIAAKQTEIDRLKEDQDKTEHDSDDLKKTIESTSGLMTDSSEHLANLTTERGRLEHELTVAEARITAEQLKIAGLQALADAQGKSLSALTRRAEEATVRSHLRAIELAILQDGQQVPAEGRELPQTDLAKARKALAIAEAKADSEERLAHDAMNAAAAKMALAETKATLAERLADNDLTLESPEVKAKAKPKPKTPAKSSEKLAAIAAPPKSAANTGTNPKPTKTKKSPMSFFAPR